MMVSRRITTSRFISKSNVVVFEKGFLMGFKKFILRHEFLEYPYSSMSYFLNQNESPEQ